MQLIDFHDKTGNGPECEMKSGAQIAITVSQAPLANNGSRAWHCRSKKLARTACPVYPRTQTTSKLIPDRATKDQQQEKPT